jgi:membrane-associated PAP2 superfamily phosphatase
MNLAAEGRSFWVAQMLLPLALLAAALALVEAAGLDRALSRLFFDPLSRTFPLRDDPFFEQVLHRGLKYGVIAFALAVFVGWAASFRIFRLAACRRVLLFVWLAMVLSTSSISMVKALSGRHCPYDLTDYGGWAPYTGLLDPLPAGVPPGHCFPGGHASAGFSLFAAYFAALHFERRKLATAALALAWGLGLGLGLGRVAQGAHFLSHNLWTALICWVLTALLYRTLLGRERKHLNLNGVSV